MHSGPHSLMHTLTRPLRPSSPLAPPQVKLDINSQTDDLILHPKKDLHVFCKVLQDEEAVRLSEE